MPRILITGVTGFVGSHLAEIALRERGNEVFGTRRWRSRTENLEDIGPRLRLVDCDLRDAGGVERVLRDVRPDQLYHLAAQSYVPASWASPAETLDTNIQGQLNLLEAIRNLKLRTRILVAGSSEEYGLVHPRETPINEENPLRPLSPYAVSKVAQDMLAWQYFRSYGIHTIRTRAFNHTGPRRGEVFVTSNFAKQVAEAEAGKRPAVLSVGNLDAKRDFVDVRDVVRAYALLMRKGAPGDVYNVATGKAWRIRDVVTMLVGQARIPMRVVVDRARLRPSDVELLVGDASKLRRLTGWRPQIPFSRTLADLLEYWRRRVG